MTGRLGDLRDLGVDAVQVRGGRLDQHYYSATSHTFIGQMYTLLGLQNIADNAKASSDYPQLSSEYIVASNPDLIVLADTVCCGQNRATVAARPGWSNIAAVKTGEVVPVNDSIASEWGRGSSCS